MAQGRKKSLTALNAGLVGAAAGAVIGATTGVILGSKDTRKRIEGKISIATDKAIGVYESIAQQDSMAHARIPVGIKGGKKRAGKKKSK